MSYEFFFFNKRCFIILILILEMQGVLGRLICPRQVIFRLAGAEKPALLDREVIKILEYRISFFEVLEIILDWRN